MFGSEQSYSTSPNKVISDDINLSTFRKITGNDIAENFSETWPFVAVADRRQIWAIHNAKS